MYRILIVEDEVKIAETVKQYLERDGHDVRHVTTAADALSCVTAETDLIILDLMLPDGQGEDVCERVVALYDTPVIMLTSKSSEQSRISGFARGADDYLTKPFSPRELAMRVKSVLKRARPKDNVIHLEDDIVLFLDRRAVTKKGTTVKLTPNEYAILLCLANNRQAAVGRDKLIEYINAHDAFDRTVDVHVRHLRQKIEDDPGNPRIIKTVHGFGYMLGVKRYA
ncbi:MAG: response regulator transcription factor [Desulfovibrio sp.]|jgi:DNA-binding response OmpR family regulator|nr:response regulator transcription factor [Desulfovibrio sp.]